MRDSTTSFFERDWTLSITDVFWVYCLKIMVNKFEGKRLTSLSNQEPKTCEIIEIEIQFYLLNFNFFVSLYSISLERGSLNEIRGGRRFVQKLVKLKTD